MRSGAFVSRRIVPRSSAASISLSRALSALRRHRSPWRGFRNAEGVHEAKDNGVALRSGQRPVFLFVFEEYIPIMLKIDIVDLPTGGVHVIEGHQSFKGIDDCVVASVARDLRLVVPDQPDLGHFGYVLRLQERPVQW